MKKKLAVALVATIMLSSLFLVLMPHAPSVLAQYSWTDIINIYKDVNAVYTDIRKITNNETVPVDVRVYITFTEKIDLLKYYRLSANGTDFITISQGVVILSNGTYFGLEQGQTLYFAIEAKGASSLSVDDIVEVGVIVEFWSAEYEHDVATVAISLSENIVGQGHQIHVNVTVQNQGNFTETFNVTCYANSTLIQTQTVINLEGGNSTSVTFTWNTTGVVYGNYAISANASIVLGETDIADNTLVDGTVLMTFLSDISGPVEPDHLPDGVVDMWDLGFIDLAYGKTELNSDWDDYKIADIRGPEDPLGSGLYPPDGQVDMWDLGYCGLQYGESVYD